MSSIFQKIGNIIKKPYLIKMYIVRRFPRIVSDESYIKIMYQACFDKKLDLTNPRTFNEKLQWLKLYDRKPEYSNLVDKYEVKKIVSDKIGPDKIGIIPTLAVFDSYDDIDFSKLPEKFVLKCTHDSGSVVICKDRSKFDYTKAKKKLKKALNNNYFYKSREFPYKNVRPRIIAEPYMEDVDSGQLYDYKIFCFNGEPKYLFIASDRASGDAKFDYYDINFNKLQMRQAVHKTSNINHVKPDCFDDMLDIARKLSKNIIQVRVDFYIVNGIPFFGEMTFFHHGGYVPFIPEKYDYIWGEQIELPIGEE